MSELRDELEPAPARRRLRRVQTGEVPIQRFSALPAEWPFRAPTDRGTLERLRAVDPFEDLLNDAAGAQPAPSPRRRLRIAMVGTRGVPAAYGGFETAVEEIGRRLVERGHEVTVYCRPKGDERPAEHLGMKLVHLPSMKQKQLETLSHTALSALHLSITRKHDAAFVFNAANSPFVPLIRMRGVPTAVHVDGLEWKRGKWGKWGKRYYRMAEEFAVRTGNALIADAQGIADYYADEFGVPTELLTYGSNRLEQVGTDKIAARGLEPGKFHLVVARFEPENHVHVIVEGYRRSAAKYPLVVVGSAPYAAEYTDRIQKVADEDPRIRMLGGVWDQDELNQLYAHARTYVHGHSVGGTNPSLLRAMGAGTAVLAWDVVFNREVAGDDGLYFRTRESLAALLQEIEADPFEHTRLGEALQERAAERYNWDDVAAGYEDLALRLADGQTLRGPRGRRNPESAWRATTRRRELVPVPVPVESRV